MRGSSRVRWIGILAAVAMFHGRAVAGDLPPDAQVMWDAAQALYGGGLTIKPGKAGVTITASGLTQDKFNKYVDVYLDALQTVSFKRTGTSFKWSTGYDDAKFDSRAKLKLGVLLLEPAVKFNICAKLASNIGDKPTNQAKYDREAWCVEQGIRDATTNTCVFRGETVTCSNAEDHGALGLDEAIFVKDRAGNYPIVVTVSGGRDHITQSTISIAGSILGNMVSIAKQASKITADWKSRLKKYFVKERAAKAKQRKLAKNRIAFSDENFAPWEVRQPAKQVSCKTPNVIMYAPAKELPNGYYYIVSVDGKQCDEHPLGAGETMTDNVYRTEQCRNMLDKGATHKIEVGLYEMKIGSTSTKKELVAGKVKDVTYEWGTSGKKVFTGTVACAMP